MNKLVALFLIALTITGLCALSIPLVSAESSDITILNYTWYIAPSTSYYPGDLIVVGEIQNTGSSVIDFVALSGIAYTTDGEAQAQSGTSAYVENLLPQQKAPFYIDFSIMSTLSGNLTWLPLLDRVDLRVIRADATEASQYDGLSVSASTAYLDANNYYTVVGYLQNVGSQQSGKVWAVGTFYNEAGETIATSYTNFLANYTNPGESIQFSLIPLDVTAELSGKITSYSLLLQSYAPEPTPSPTPPVSQSPNGSPTASPSGQPTQSPGPDQGSSSTLVTALAAIAVVVVVIVVVLMFVRKKSKPQVA